MIDMTLSGLRDKLYWRAAAGQFHCFKKAEGGYLSLCRRFTRRRSDGQRIDRPEAHLRCGVCDGREMDRRGWHESGPATVEAAPPPGGRGGA